MGMNTGILSCKDHFRMGRQYVGQLLSVAWPLAGCVLSTEFCSHHGAGGQEQGEHPSTAALERPS